MIIKYINVYVLLNIYDYLFVVKCFKCYEKAKLERMNNNNNNNTNNISNTINISNRTESKMDIDTK